MLVKPRRRSTYLQRPATWRQQIAFVALLTILAIAVAVSTLLVVTVAR